MHLRKVLFQIVDWSNHFSSTPTFTKIRRITIATWLTSIIKKLFKIFKVVLIDLHRMKMMMNTSVSKQSNAVTKREIVSFKKKKTIYMSKSHRSDEQKLVTESKKLTVHKN